MTKKLFVKIIVVLFSLVAIVACGNPADTSVKDDQKTDPVLVSLAGTEITNATLTTEIISEKSSGAELTTLDGSDVIKVSSAAIDDGYEIRCEIIFDPALDLSTATTISFKTLMSFDYSFISINTENSDTTLDDLNTMITDWHGAQAELYEHSYTLADQPSQDWAGTPWANTTKKVTKIEFYSTVTAENYLSPDFDTANISEVAFN
ncbi:hypothetical protein EW093_06595 [Thiospirochaeta perfilievii]|uniref:Uncharacterized protein n=1 Tax=Thiospirochaeta perfilievii TaxID=252967 RepID=A0A5C1QBX5_9SPIO|nr:hypothetical protein [Thiospirochaeta perfilievii]QEN04379.1 hypothetical protein EW093_06595 [Thiospirochaeta perfilievii]